MSSGTRVDARGETMTTIYFATNRKLAPGAEFSGAFHDNLDELRFGTATCEGRELFKKEIAHVAASATIEVAAERLSAENAAASRLGSMAVFSRLQAELRETGKDALIYVHGYNYSFRDSVARACQLQQWLAAGGRDTVVCLFAWPSQGAGVSPGAYRDDRNRAAAAGPALGRAILKAVDFIRGTPRGQTCNARLHLVAHSMGAWALRGAVQSMRTFVGDNIPPLFEEVLLFAADEDDDALSARAKLSPLLRGCRRATVYLNRQDLALKASDVAMGNPDRLGKAGPAQGPDLPPKVVTVNASPAIIWDATGAAAWTRDETGHQYYRNNPIVRDDIVQVLAGISDADIKGRAEKPNYWLLG